MMEIRRIEPGDRVALARFLDGIPEADRTFLKENVADQEALIAMFRALGFEPEALLLDHVRDRSGELRDLLVLAHSVQEQWASMAAAGVVERL
jgi:hypothetical protein